MLSVFGTKFRISWNVLLLVGIFCIGYLLIVTSLLYPQIATTLTDKLSDRVNNVLSVNVTRNQMNLRSSAPVVQSKKFLEIKSENTDLKGKLEILERELNELKTDGYIEHSARYQKLTEQYLKIESELHELNSTVNSAPVLSPRNIHNARSGVIILGMHRSGTSVVGGLMNKMGLNTGGPLIGAAEDNVKGFFERIDVVNQNDMIMRRQTIDYTWNTHKYDALAGLNLVLNTIKPETDTARFFAEGRRALTFLNGKENYPWMLKDPRLCITVKTWLPLLHSLPAVLFIFRHPLDVALSHHHREGLRIGKALRMWYIYNRMGVQQSSDLCRVVGSHRQIMSNSRREMDRIYHELRDNCEVPVPHPVPENDLITFVDPNLQHGRTTKTDRNCEILATDPSALLLIVPPESAWVPETQEHFRVYRECIRVFCAMEDSSAFSNNFNWDMSIIDD